MASTIPTVQRAYVLPSLGEPLRLVHDHPVTPSNELLPGQCLVKLTHSGVCHSDLAIKEGWFAARTTPKPNLVGGHEGIGFIVAIGEHTYKPSVKIGDRVGITYMADTCQNCEHCRKGLEQYCTQIKKTGTTVDGTFSEYAVTFVDHVVPIPESLDGAEAAPLMCAGFTSYSALKQCGAHAGNWVVVNGAGGGLGHLAVQYAVTMGLRVVAVDSGEEKRKLALDLGAERWIDYNKTSDVTAEIIKATEGGAHAAIIAVGESAVYNQAISYLRSRGYIIGLGLPRGGVMSIPILPVSARGITIRGVFIGSRQDALEAVRLAAAGKVKCQYTLRGLSELEQVYKDMEENKIVGRAVLDISK